MPDLLKILPQLLWIALAALALSLAAAPALRMIEGDKVSRIAVAGLQVAFAREQLARAKTDDDGMRWLETPENFAPFRDRIEREAAQMRGARMLWVDDEHPQQNIYKRRAFAALGISVDTLQSTEAALSLMPGGSEAYHHIIISDLGRPGQPEDNSACYGASFTGPRAAGCCLLSAVRERFGDLAPPIILYYRCWPVWEFADPVQITQSVLEARWKALVFLIPSHRLLRHTLLRSAHHP